MEIEVRKLSSSHRRAQRRSSEGAGCPYHRDSVSSAGDVQAEGRTVQRQAGGTAMVRPRSQLRTPGVTAEEGTRDSLEPQVGPPSRQPLQPSNRRGGNASMAKQRCNSAARPVSSGGSAADTVLPRPVNSTGPGRNIPYRKLMETEAELFRRRAQMVRELDRMGISTLRGAVDPPSEALSRVFRAAQQRKAKLAQMAGLTTLRQCATGTPTRPSDVQPDTSAGLRSWGTDEAEEPEWEIRQNRAQGQLGVWVGQQHVTPACGAGRQGRGSDKMPHPQEIPYLRFTEVPKWLTKPSWWYNEPTEGYKGHDNHPAIDGSEDWEAGDDSGAVAEALRRYRKPAVGNLQFGPESLLFTDPPRSS